ncbi:SidA/IucD/PvdA family monooxygenase [Chromohalobacter israelensis]|uniref:SidA/IucD/PvdA family monooxygenase n=1 Tax=Chromohalobacter israelensis TaxID=141390 RepID=UPI0015C45A34|nr:SidA/IucD/PvdA family monooxygenase [Chromohalobacter salexigens]NWO57055.1 ornithine monooxygenase [Chromohalobacter salexigens]
MTKIYDLIGVGFGPNNIGLAVHATQKDNDINMVFLEKRDELTWQNGMMVPGADIQHSPHRDFITPIDPTSDYTFLNYLKSHNRLLNFLNIPATFPFRLEWSLYVQWVASHFLETVKLGQHVTKIEQTLKNGTSVFRVITEDGKEYLGRSVALGTGGKPIIPEELEPYLGERVYHLTDYQTKTNQAIKDGCKKFAVVGASQSAVEILIDLYRKPGVEITAITRGIGFRQKDLSPFTEHIFFPEFVEWFQRRDADSRRQINSELETAVYGRADKDALDELYRLWYEDHLQGQPRMELKNYCEIEKATINRSINLFIREKHSNTQSSIKADAVIVATGFERLERGINSHKTPSILKDLESSIEHDRGGNLYIASDYSLGIIGESGNRLPIFMTSFSAPSHGVGDAGTFPLLAHRSAAIISSLTEQLKAHKE